MKIWEKIQMFGQLRDGEKPKIASSTAMQLVHTAILEVESRRSGARLSPTAIYSDLRLDSPCKKQSCGLSTTVELNTRVYIGRAFPREIQKWNNNIDKASLGFTSEFRNGLISGIFNKKTFITTNGYLGLGSRIIQPGDQVVVVPGLYTPLIVRKRPDK